MKIRVKIQTPYKTLNSTRTDHDDMCDELSWYEEHFEQMSDLLVLLEKFYPQNPSKRVQK